ncbi:MAG: ABC transporter permease, partial [Anaerolineae bacterium]|nr:ABC transporter permease [Anaerolineae bacterium]
KGGLVLHLLDLLPLPMTFRQAVRNVLQKRGRLVLNVVTLALASGAFMGVLGMLMVINNTMDDIFATFGSEIVVMPQRATDLEQAQNLVRDEIEGVELVSPAMLMVVEIEGYDPPQMAGGIAMPLYVFGFETNDPQLFNFHLSEGTAWENDPNREGIVVTKGIMDRLDKKLGDTLTLRLGENRADYEIIGVSTYPFDDLWLPWEEVSRLAGTSNANAFYIMLESDAMTADQVNDKIKEINAVLLANSLSATYINWTLSQETASKLLVTFTMTLNIAALLIGLVGALGLLSSLSMSVFERQKEIGVMRSVGATSTTIAAQFMIEGLLVGLAAWLVGIPLSMAMYDLLLTAFNFKDAIASGLPSLVLVIGLLTMAAVATISSLSPSLAAARKTVSDILRYQ